MNFSAKYEKRIKTVLDRLNDLEMDLSYDLGRGSLGEIDETTLKIYHDKVSLCAKQLNNLFYNQTIADDDSPNQVFNEEELTG